jgi:hypothetical protein
LLNLCFLRRGDETPPVLLLPLLEIELLELLPDSSLVHPLALLVSITWSVGEGPSVGEG